MIDSFKLKNNNRIKKKKAKSKIIYKYKIFPTNATLFWSQESKKLRNILKMFSILNSIFFIGDIYLYDVEIFCMIADIILIFFGYYNYMLLLEPVIIV